MLRALWLIALIIASPALAQEATLQGGPFTPGHSPMFVGQGSVEPVLQDSGPAGGGGLGVGLSEQLLVARGTGSPPYAGQGTGPSGTNWCDYDAPLNSPNGYHYLCLSANAAGGGLITYGAGGGASDLPLQFLVNGSSGVSCAAGTVNLTTLTITSGVVTHC